MGLKKYMLKIYDISVHINIVVHTEYQIILLSPFHIVYWLWYAMVHYFREALLLVLHYATNVPHASTIFSGHILYTIHLYTADCITMC